MDTSISEEKLYNFSSLQKLTNNDPTFFKHLIKSALDHINDFLPIIKNALEENNEEVILSEIHKLKASLNILGIEKVELLCKSIEKELIENHSVDDVKYKIAELISYMKIAENQFRELLID